MTESLIASNKRWTSTSSSPVELIHATASARPSQPTVAYRISTFRVRTWLAAGEPLSCSYQFQVENKHRMNGVSVVIHA